MKDELNEDEQNIKQTVMPTSNGIALDEQQNGK